MSTTERDKALEILSDLEQRGIYREITLAGVPRTPAGVRSVGFQQEGTPAVQNLSPLTWPVA
jgi:hypothetical protein